MMLALSQPVDPASTQLISQKQSQNNFLQFQHGNVASQTDTSSSPKLRILRQSLTCDCKIVIKSMEGRGVTYSHDACFQPLLLFLGNHPPIWIPYVGILSKSWLVSVYNVWIHPYNGSFREVLVTDCDSAPRYNTFKGRQKGGCNRTSSRIQASR